MKWVTRDHVHLDRVAAPWLIRRFVDADAQFLFVPTGGDQIIPPDAIGFGIPGGRFPPHDAEGSTFRKIMVAHDLIDPALVILAEVIEDAIAHFLREKRDGGADPKPLRHQEAIGLIALSEGMQYATSDDQANLTESLIIYDALYAMCRARLLEKERPELKGKMPSEVIDILKPLIS